MHAIRPSRTPSKSARSMDTCAMPSAGLEQAERAPTWCLWVTFSSCNPCCTKVSCKKKPPAGSSAWSCNSTRQLEAQIPTCLHSCRTPACTNLRATASRTSFMAVDFHETWTKQCEQRSAWKGNPARHLRLRAEFPAAADVIDAQKWQVCVVGDPQSEAGHRLRERQHRHSCRC